MKTKRNDRREFLKSSLTTAAVAAGSWKESRAAAQEPPKAGPARIRFAAIGLNHGHINGQVESVIRGGGELVSFFAKEAGSRGGVRQSASRRRSSRAARRRSSRTRSIQLVVSASIPNERAPLGIEVMRHGKDFMVDKPGMTTLEQLAEVRKVQAETKRIYSVLYSERHENRATIKAGELVKAGRHRQGDSDRSASDRIA